MSTMMRKQIVWFSFLGLLAAAAPAAAQRAPRTPRVPAVPALPSFQTPVAPLAPPAPVAPPAPLAPLPPAVDRDFNFDFDFNFDHDFNFDFKGLSDLHIDTEAIRESARAAAESAREFSRSFSFQGPNPPSPPNPPNPPRLFIGGGRDGETEADNLYTQARQQIDQGRYDRAIQQLDRLIILPGATRVDAALYWKSYSLARQGQRDQALSTLADMQKRFGDSRWLKDAKALEVEVRQASGQAVSPDAQNDEELKLLALRGILQSDPDRALPMIERLLAGNGSIKLRENALFVLSQSRTAKAREIITGIAKGGANPDLQARAIRYLGAIGGPETRQTLIEIYRSSNDKTLKRAMLQSMRASDGLDQLMEIARTEKDVDLKRTAIRSMGQNGDRDQAVEVLKSIYASDTNTDIRREVINQLSSHNKGAALVDLARAEKDPALKKEIVQRLANMKSKEATDFLLELLK